MLIPFVLFVILSVWALVQADMYAKEGVILFAIWAFLLVGLFMLGTNGFYCVVPMVLIDIWLLIRLVGNPSIG